MNLPPIKCAGCRACCIGDTITLMPERGDDVTQYKTKRIGSNRVLAKNKHGNCVYLGRVGCQIYGRQPYMCRVFDCRKYALSRAGDPPTEERKLAGFNEGVKRIQLLGVAFPASAGASDEPTRRGSPPADLDIE